MFETLLIRPDEDLTWLQNWKFKPAKLECTLCQAVIGQVDASGYVIEREHKAPCNLPCKLITIPSILAETHHGNLMCPRCKPHKCPACKGRGVSPFLGRATDYSITCTRCNGDGRIQGFDGDEND